VPLGAAGVPKQRADDIASELSSGGGGSGSGLARQAGDRVRQILDAVQHDFAQATRTVFVVMAAIMAACFAVAASGCGAACPITWRTPERTPAQILRAETTTSGR
jgi:hypothetical protein